MFNFVIKGMGISLYRHKWLCIAVHWYQFENNLHENNPVISTVHNTFSRGWKAANLNFSVFRRITAGKDGSLIIVRLYNSSQQIITLTIFNCPSLAVQIILIWEEFVSVHEIGIGLFIYNKTAIPKTRSGRTYILRSKVPVRFLCLRHHYCIHETKSNIFGFLATQAFVLYITRGISINI